MPRYKSWDQIRRELALSDETLDAYARLEDAEHRLADAIAVENLDPWLSDRADERYLFQLAQAVASAGGRLELRAVFEDREVVLLTEPDPEPEPEPRSGSPSNAPTT